MIGNVHEFHQKFGLPLGAEDQLLDDPAVQAFRVKFMREELGEFIEAVMAGDRVKALDALLDLVYVVHGTALFMGVSPAQWDAGMRAVHNCNMAKERVAKASDSKRGSAWDVGKPVGWVGPEARLKEILSW